MKVYADGRVVVKSWCEDIEPGALEQAQHLAQLPFAFHHVALMPDCHQGYGMPIGGVLATKNAVIPNAVGVDIGCGMTAVRTSLPVTDLWLDELKRMLGGIRERVPVGFQHHAINQPLDWEPQGVVTQAQYNASKRQVGTLGGGNHFIELQSGSDGELWLMLHSGSRNVGKQVEEFYNKLAVSLNERWHSSVPSEWGLAFLPLDSAEGQAYLAEMLSCLQFARENRRRMMDACCDAVAAVRPEAQFVWRHDIHHNYAQLEHHYGQNVVVHRKGATMARLGEVGIIPGSQGTKSYIVAGKGNPESFQSCSHGAGRKLARRAAQRTLSLEDEVRKLDEKRILHSIRNVSDLDEAAGAYKDIDVVMAAQADLVDIVTELTPLGVVKG